MVMRWLARSLPAVLICILLGMLLLHHLALLGKGALPFVPIFAS